MDLQFPDIRLDSSLDPFSARGGGRRDHQRACQERELEDCNVGGESVGVVDGHHAHHLVVSFHGSV